MKILCCGILCLMCLLVLEEDNPEYITFIYKSNASADSISLKLTDEYLIQSKTEFIKNKLIVREIGDSLAIDLIDTFKITIDTFKINIDSTFIHYSLLRKNQIIDIVSLPLKVGEKSVHKENCNNKLFFLPCGEIEFLDKTPDGGILFYKGRYDGYGEFEFSLHRRFFVPVDFEMKYEGRHRRNFMREHSRIKKMYIVDDSYYFDEKTKKLTHFSMY